MTDATLPNIYDLSGDELVEFTSAASEAAAKISAAGIECTPTHVARASQISSLLETAALARTTTVSPPVTRLASNDPACVVLTLALEELGVDLAALTPEQVAGFCSKLEVVISSLDKKRPKFR